MRERLIEISRHSEVQGVFWITEDKLYGAVRGDIVVRTIAMDVFLVNTSNFDVARSCFTLLRYLDDDAIVYVGQKAIRLFKPNIVIILDKGSEYGKSINRSVRKILSKCDTKTASSTTTP